MNKSRLFLASCVALVTTSMVFSIRGDILDALGADFNLNNKQIGQVLSPAFWGFTVSILLGGSLVDFFGMRRLLFLSGFGYIGAVLAIIVAPTPDGPVAGLFQHTGVIILYLSMLALGLSQGLVEGVINPLCSTLYPEDKTRRLNILHAWWPGGLIIGGLLAFAITKAIGLDGDVSAATATFGWQLKLTTILVAALAYLAIARGQHFPATERVAAGVSNSEMLREVFRPMFLLLWACMWMTASTELAPDQWVASLVTNLTGMQGILLLVYTAGIMFTLRFFAGGVAKRFSPFAVLTVSAILSAIGLYQLGAATTTIDAFMAATIFGVGKTYFWPVMLGLTAELFPKGGALALAIMGGTGNLSIAFILPVIGRWYDTEGAAAAFQYVARLPIVLTFIFAGLYLYFRAKGGYKAVKLS